VNVNTLTYQSTDQREILKVLTYYHVFKHPLRIDEIYHYINIRISTEGLQKAINNLIQNNEVYLIKDHYCLYDDVDLVNNRIAGKHKANKLLVKARRIGKLLSYFPFVRFVGISGSLSKAYADDNTDFDYFIITKYNRLWVSRSILHLFKKFSFLFNMQKCFCMNYFIDESSLALEDKNIYVAYEIASMIPVNNKDLYNEFIYANRWVIEKLPQIDYSTADIYEHKSTIKWLIEKCLSVFALDNLNKLLMKITDYKWRHKWKKANYSPDDYEQAFRTRINISKNHPKNYQKLLLAKLSEFL
jgi:hypothetical protein